MFKLKYPLQEGAGDGGGDGGGGSDPWYAPIAGDNEAHIGVLKEFETPDAFFTKFNELSEGGDTVSMEQFRKVAAGDNEDYQKALARYNSPEEVTKALVESKARIREGFKVEDYPGEGTDEEKAAWRETAGLPADAAGYFDALEGDVAIGDDDKPLFESFANKLFERNIGAGALDAAAEWYNEWVTEQTAAEHEQDVQDQQAVDDALTTEFGPAEYRGLKNNAMHVLKQFMPAEDVEQLLHGRLQDGTGFFNNAGITKGIMAMAKAIQPVSPLPGFGNDPGKSIDGRLAEISKMRKDNYDKYMKDEAVQKEERELIDAQQNLKNRAA